MMSQEAILASVLASNGPHPELPFDQQIFRPFIGSWDLVVTWYEADGTVRRRENGEWHFAWALEGRAVQDVWIVPPRAERQGRSDLYEYGTSLRFFDPELSAWRSTWIGPIQHAVHTWLFLDSGVVTGSSCDKGSDEGAEQGFAPVARVVNELEEAEVNGQLLLRDAPMRSQPRAQQRPDALDRIDVYLAEAVTVLVAGVFTAAMAHHLVPVAPTRQASIDVVLVGVDESASGNGRLNDRLDRRLLHIGQHVQDHVTAALDQAEDRRLVLLQRAASRRPFQAPPPPEPPLFATSAGFPLCPATT
jgi:hypothetical protein